MEDVALSKLSQVPLRDIPEIKDKELSLIVERINREFGGKLLDQDSIGYPRDGIPFWPELSSQDRSIISRTVNALKRNEVNQVGQVRGLGVEGVMIFRNMGEIKTTIALRMYAPLEEVSGT